MTIVETHLCQKEIYELLIKADKDFDPYLSKELDFEHYSNKWSNLARMVVAFEGRDIIGSVFFYLNEQSHVAYIPLFWTDSRFQRKGVGKGMFEVFKSIASNTCYIVELEVMKSNSSATAFYRNLGFFEIEDRGIKRLLSLKLK